MTLRNRLETWGLNAMAVAAVVYFALLMDFIWMVATERDFSAFAFPLLSTGKWFWIVVLTSTLYLVRAEGGHHNRSGGIAFCGAISLALVYLLLSNQHIRFAAEQRVEIHNNLIVASEKIGPTFDQTLARVARLLPGDHKTLVLRNNDGGNFRAAMRAGSILKDLGIENVVVSGYCASSCAQLWLQAKNRVLAADSVVGFHRVFGNAATADANGLELLQDLQAQRESLLSYGVARAVIDQIMSTDSSQMLYFDRDSLARAGISVAPISPPQMIVPAGA